MERRHEELLPRDRLDLIEGLVVRARWISELLWMCSREGLLTSRMRNMWSLIFFLGRAQPPLSVVLLFLSRSIGAQGTNSHRLPWWPICLLPQYYTAHKDVLYGIIGAWRKVWKEISSGCLGYIREVEMLNVKGER